MKNLILFSFITVFLCTQPALAASDGEQLSLKGFRMELPAQWEEIPAAELDRLNATSATRSETGMSQNYEYGYQRAKTGKWFDYPYILIRRHTGGRWTKEQIVSVDKDFEAATSRYSTRFDKLVSKASSNKGIYDPEKDIVWTTFNVNLAKIGPVTGLSGLKLTNNGYIQIVAYERSPDFEKNSETYRSIIESVVVDPNLSYDNTSAGKKHSKADTGSKSSFGRGKVIAFAVVAIIGVAFLKTLKKAKAKS